MRSSFITMSPDHGTHADLDVGVVCVAARTQATPVRKGQTLRSHLPSLPDASRNASSRVVDAMASPPFVCSIVTIRYSRGGSANYRLGGYGSR